MHPILTRYRTQFLKGMVQRSTQNNTALSRAPSTTHDRLLEAFSPAGDVHGAPGYFKIMYCPTCLHGRVVDFVRDVGEDIPAARDIGVINKTKGWTGICPIKVKENKHREVQK